jgi:2-amino-4-hydroxy-6-hydroxymethyldihydropteridine diphosphokinase
MFVTRTSKTENQTSKIRKMLSKVCLSLGSNLGEREVLLRKAVELIGENIGEVLAVSSIYETLPWGKTDQPNFLNLALVVITELSPEEVLTKTQFIENQLGKDKKEHWGARLIDIDIVLFEDKIIDTPHLKIPHPYLHERTFVLEPLAEIAPDFVHPILGKTIEELLLSCRDVS